VSVAKSQIFISGNLEGLNCTEKSVSDLIKALLQVKPDLKKIFKDRPVNLSFISKKTIKELNLEFLKKDKPTNVLSFPSRGLSFGDEILGDIAICPEIIKKEAAIQNKEEQDHLSHLIIHSLLHLAGYDHQEADSAKQMESLEVKALKKLGIANPY
tara:strand:- start:73 stop:540 length:468 start_codon:yes stop_codon:yes gene_type:complete